MPAPDRPTSSLADANSSIAPSVQPDGPSPAFPPRDRRAVHAGPRTRPRRDGVIHRAIDGVLGREVSVKVLRERYAPTSGAAVRFADIRRWGQTNPTARVSGGPPAGRAGRRSTGRWTRPASAWRASAAPAGVRPKPGPGTPSRWRRPDP